MLGGEEFESTYRSRFYAGSGEPTALRRSRLARGPWHTGRPHQRISLLWSFRTILWSFRYAPEGALHPRSAFIWLRKPLLCFLVAEQLEAEGFDVVAAESDEEGWEMYQGRGIDRIVVVKPH